MDHRQFQEWLSGIDHLSPAQRQQTEAVCLGDTETSASLAAIEAAGSPVPALWHARGHIAWQGKGSATVPVQRMQEDIQCRDRHPLSGLHRKDRWLSFGACLADGLTVRASAERCGLAVNTAFRWRHRFPAAKDLKARKLTGIVEADETCVPESRKGARNLERKASKRGLSDEQVPVLVAADRSGATAVIPPKSNRKGLRDDDTHMYKWRHLIENCFAKIKEFRGMATRYDKTDTSYAANWHLCAMLVAAR